MKLRQNNLIDLYRRLINFISSNYPNVMIVECEKNVIVTYPDALGRIAISQDANETTLIVDISLKINEQISSRNTKSFFVSTIDELNCLKSGIQVVLEMVKTENTNQSTTKVTTANSGQGYLLDENKELISVVELSMIPTNAFVRNVDTAKQIKHIEIEEPKETQQERTIKKFFKR